MIVEEVRRRIEPVDPVMAARAQAILDAKTKPRRSLGRIEDLACQLAAIRHTTELTRPEKAIVVIAADHGVAAEGVSAYPQAVTAQMLLNFARGGAAINVLARLTEARLLVLDMGVKEPPPATTPEILSRRIGSGTQNFTQGPAMTREQLHAAIGVGLDVADGLADERIGLLGIGDMGIANTTAASALATLLTGAPVEKTVGRGTGVDDAGLGRKIEAVRKGIEVNRPDPNDTLQVLATLGGFEIAGLCGVVLGAAARRVPVVLDGFISSVAALAAVRLTPDVGGYLIASHLSVEAGHRPVLEALRKEPLLDLELRLGEGTGAALAMGLVDAAVAVLQEMATFSSAGVSDSGR